MIPITKPLVGEPEALAAAEVVRSGWLTQGAAQNTPLQFPIAPQRCIWR